MAMRSRFLLRSVSLLLIACTLFSVFAPLVPAAETADRVCYSDLFYGYSPDYLISTDLVSYAVSTSDLMMEIRDDYLDSGNSFLSAYSSSLKGISDPIAFFLILTDSLGLTDVTFDNALDAANQEFAMRLLGEPGSQSSQFIVSTAKFTEHFDQIDDVMKGLEEEFDFSSLTETEAVTALFQYLD